MDDSDTLWPSRRVFLPLAQDFVATILLLISVFSAPIEKEGNQASVQVVDKHVERVAVFEPRPARSPGGEDKASVSFVGMASDSGRVCIR